MKGALLALLVAMAACTSSLPAGTPPPGPAIPNGAHPVDVTSGGPGAFGCGNAPAIFAGSSLVEVKIPVIERCRSLCDTPGSACWAELPNQPDKLYFVVLTANECFRPVQEVAAVRGSTLYFIHWIGKPTAVCNAMMVRPAYRLFMAARSLLPASGMVTVELQIQDEVDGTSIYDAYVNLG